MTTNRWRICIDFGTATSKASLCAAPGEKDQPKDVMHPLKLGHVTGEQNSFLVQSMLLFEAGRVNFGALALERANDPVSRADPLHSFKTFLASRDLEQAIHLRLRRNVDESNAFSQYDAIVLYTAYLLVLSDRAL
ncbi:MAG: hypothetical protein ABUL42_02260, partial [Terricaulis silvestris]